MLIGRGLDPATAGPQCDLTACKDNIITFMNDEIRDSKRSGDRIPDTLRSEWKAIDDKAHIRLGRTKCVRCGRSEQPAEDASENISEEARTRLEDIDSIANSMSDEDAIVYYLEKHPNLKGCFGTNDETVLLGAKALESMEKTEDIVMMGFDAGREQLDALESGSIDGRVVQNPFGMGYAAVIAAARTALEIGNEAQVDTGFIWVDAENMEDESMQAMLYE